MTEIAAALIWREGKVLACQREQGGSCSLLWEFPGGKREAGESMEGCLVRECREELGVTVQLSGLYEELDHQYGEKAFHFAFYWASIIEGEPQKRVHRAMRWLAPEQLGQLEFCPANEPLIQRLMQEKQLPKSQ